MTAPLVTETTDSVEPRPVAHRRFAPTLGAASRRAWLAGGRTTPVAPILPLWFACLTAVGGGIALMTGFPGADVWPLTLLGAALILLSLIGRRWNGALLVGLIGGLTFWCAHISWLTLYLGPVPWLALAGLEAMFFAIGSIAIALVYRFANAVWPTRLGRLGILPVVIAGLWTAREAIPAVAPEGGFSWGRGP